MQKSTRKTLCTKRWSRTPESQDLQKDRFDPLWSEHKDSGCRKKEWKKAGLTLCSKNSSLRSD
ncbi:hypothetical protein ROGSH02058M1_027830 [Raoultella ornithinolytica]|nr:hypothetical protein ROGSH02058M1_027830 [Raoultella ornithinolytica]